MDWDTNFSFMNRLFFITLVILIFFIASCTEKVDLKIPDEQPQLVVNSIIYPNNNVRVSLYHTTSISTNTDSRFINATIKLFENGNLIGTFTEIEQGVYELEYKPKELLEYKIEIRCDEFEVCRSIDVIPSKPVISDAGYVLPAWYDEEEMTVMSKCSFTIDDPEEEENFYELEIYEIHEAVDGSERKSELSHIVCNEDVLISEGLQSYNPSTIFFSDKLFNGKKHQFSFDCDFNGKGTYISNDTVTYITEGTHLILQVRAISKHYYEFRKSCTKHFYNQSVHELRDFDEISRYMFSGEPMRLYSNIDNGFGIFAGFSKLEIEMQKTN